MKPHVLSCVLLALAACSSSGEDVWGGYTEGEAKEALKQVASPDPRGTLDQLYPSKAEVDNADLRKAVIRGEEAWEYKRERGDGAVWCIYIREDPQTETFLGQVGPCIAD
jgi:hypothetical protein